MAYIYDEHCDTCKKITPHIDGKCGICLEKAHKDRIAKWEAMSVEDKLRNILVRVEALEGGSLIRG